MRLEFKPFNINDFINSEEHWQMKVIFKVGDFYIEGLITHFYNEPIEIALYDFNDDRYYEFDRIKHIEMYCVKGDV